MKYLYLLFAAFLAFSACEKNADLGCESVNYDEIFVAEAGKSYCFPNEVKITIDSLENGYCPCFVYCIWGGETLVHMKIEQGGETTTYVFHEHIENEALEIIKMESFEIEIDGECTRSNPNPKIVSAELKVSKL